MAFNPFWDLSNCWNSNALGWYELTFNPFWDLSLRSLLTSSLTILAFNPFWDLSSLILLGNLSIGVTFNPFWDLSRVLKICYEVAPLFQSLLGFILKEPICPFQCLKALSIPFGIYQDIYNLLGSLKLSYFQSLLGFITIVRVNDNKAEIIFQSLLGFINLAKL